MTDEVEFPEIRQDLLAAVDLLAEPYKPDPTIRQVRRGVDSEFDEIFGLLIEHLQLDEIDVREAVGYYLTSEDEGRALADLASLLQLVWDETEVYAADPAYPTDEEFQRAETWPKVVECARAARTVLRR